MDAPPPPPPPPPPPARRHTKRQGRSANRIKCVICKEPHPQKNCGWYGIWPNEEDADDPDVTHWKDGVLTIERVHIDKLAVINTTNADGKPIRVLCPRGAITGPALEYMFDHYVSSSVDFLCLIKKCQYIPQGVLTAFLVWVPGNFTEAVKAQVQSVLRKHKDSANRAALVMHHTLPSLPSLPSPTTAAAAAAAYFSFAPPPLPSPVVLLAQPQQPAMHLQQVTTTHWAPVAYEQQPPVAPPPLHTTYYNLQPPVAPPSLHTTYYDQQPPVGPPLYPQQMGWQQAHWQDVYGQQLPAAAPHRQAPPEQRNRRRVVAGGRASASDWNWPPLGSHASGRAPSSSRHESTPRSRTDDRASASSYPPRPRSRDYGRKSSSSRHESTPRSRTDDRASASSYPPRPRPRAGDQASSSSRHESTPPRATKRVCSELPLVKELPVAKQAAAIMTELKKRDNFYIVTAETGSGKTTQIPKMAYNAFGGCVVVTQPRRIAVRETVNRITNEVGDLASVKMWIRGEKEDCPDSADILVVTDGILRNLAAHPQRMSSFSAVIVDEAHERSENLDVLLMWLKRNETRMPNLSVIIMSATVSAQTFIDQFDATPIQVEGRAHEITVRHRWTEPRAHSLRQYAKPPHGEIILKVVPSTPEAAGEMAFYVHVMLALDATVDAPCGDDILVFVEGEGEVRQAIKYIEESMRKLLAVVPNFRSVKAVPLMRKMAKEDQARAIKRDKYAVERKIIVATNIAETSLTIDGILAVVDSGNVKRSAFTASTTLSELKTGPVSQAEAKQRAGRAGRQQPGLVFRCYDEQTYSQYAVEAPPEINRCDVRRIVMELNQAGVPISAAPFIVTPDDGTVKIAMETLRFCGALTSANECTDIGRAIVALPLDPNCALLVAHAAGTSTCIRQAVKLAALLSADENIYQASADDRHADRKRSLSAVKGKHACQTSMLAMLAVFNAHQNAQDQRKKHIIRRDYNLSHAAIDAVQETVDDVHDRIERLFPTARLESSSHEVDWYSLRQSICKAFAMTAARPTGFRRKDKKQQQRFTLARTGHYRYIDSRIDEDLPTGDDAFAVAASQAGDRLQWVCVVNGDWLREMATTAGVDYKEIFPHFYSK